MMENIVSFLLVLLLASVTIVLIALLFSYAWLVISNVWRRIRFERNEHYSRSWRGIDYD